MYGIKEKFLSHGKANKFTEKLVETFSCENTTHKILHSRTINSIETAIHYSFFSLFFFRSLTSRDVYFHIFVCDIPSHFLFPLFSFFRDTVDRVMMHDFYHFSCVCAGESRNEHVEMLRGKRKVKGVSCLSSVMRMIVRKEA